MDGSHSLLIRTAVWHSDAARGPSTPSFDHLISAEHEAGGYLVPDRLGGLEVNHKLERGGLLDRQIGRFRAVEYLGDHSGALTEKCRRSADHSRASRPLRPFRAIDRPPASAIPRHAR